MALLELPEIYQTEPIFQRALVAAIMVGITCGVLGCFFVLRNMSLIGDALSHAILPGLVFAFMLVGYSTIGFFIGSTIAGMITAVMITWISQNVQTKADASIGIVFTFMFAVGIIGISRVARVHADGGDTSPHIDMQHFLFGNLLGVETTDLYLTAAVMIYVLFSIYIFYRYLFVATFQEVIAETMGISVQSLHYFLMLLLSFTVVASLQTVGLILVVAMLITPASTALLLSDNLKVVIVLSGIIGAITGFIGMSLAIVLDAPPGPELVVVVSFFFFLAAMFAPKKGYVYRFLQKRRLQKKIHQEDILKQAFRLGEKGPITKESLMSKLAFNASLLGKNLGRLKRKGLLNNIDQQITLTEEGKKEANRLIRAHRLWETYMVQQMGMTEEQIHEEAEKYEHLLTDDMVEEVDAKLGYPATDPHGSRIPTRKDHPDFPLSHLAPKSLAQIDEAQINETVFSELRKLGLLPETKIEVLERTPDFIEVNINGRTINVPVKLAREINIKVP